MQLAFNSKISSLTNSTPFSLMFGRSPNQFQDFVESKKATKNAVSNWKERQEELRKLIYPALNETVKKKKSKQALSFSKHNNIISDYKFPTGSQVMMRDVTQESKWDARYEGPTDVG